jgi:hypothetical protein
MKTTDLTIVRLIGIMVSTILGLIGVLLSLKIQSETIEISNKKEINRYILKEKRLKVEADSMTNESVKLWQKPNSQYWEGRDGE